MKTTFRTYFLFLLVVVLAAVAGYSVVLAQYNVAISLPSEEFIEDFDDFKVYNPPQLLPEVVLYDLDGNILNLKDLKGKWRLVNFWATWCPPCIEELPRLLELKETRGNKDFDVVFISLDYPESAGAMRRRMKQAKIPPGLHTFYVQDIEIWKTLSLESVPTSMVIGPKGRVYFKLAGETDWAGKESLAFIDDLLNN